MKDKKYFNTLIFVFITLFTFFGMYLFIRSPYYQTVNIWIQSNLILYSFCIYLVKILGIVWPPISGGIFTVASIPFLGWKLAFLLDFLGSLTGGSIAYWLGKKYGYTFLSKIFGSDISEKIKKIKIKTGKEIEAIFMYKVLFGNLIIEVIYYGAGVLQINFSRFLIGSVLAHLLVGIPSFYLVNNIFSGKDAVITITLTLIAIFVVLKTKGRYFE